MANASKAVKKPVVQKPPKKRDGHEGREAKKGCKGGGCGPGG
jgi:hypothetical protein